MPYLLGMSLWTDIMPVYTTQGIQNLPYQTHVLPYNQLNSTTPYLMTKPKGHTTIYSHYIPSHSSMGFTYSLPSSEMSFLTLIYAYWQRENFLSLSEISPE
jgi:hypothetical protein